jgi:hypothetical protein
MRRHRIGRTMPCMVRKITGKSNEAGLPMSPAIRGKAGVEHQNAERFHCLPDRAHPARSWS